jgi:hypothetical protein
MEESLKMKKPVEPASAKRVALALAVFLSPANARRMPEAAEAPAS